LGVHFTIISPGALCLDEDLTAKCAPFRANSGAQFRITEDISEVRGADAVYTDVWASMGEEDKKAERTALLGPYQVNSALMAKTGRADTIFLHCLPAVRGEEISSDVLDGPQSRAWDQAENRKHTIKGIMLATLDCI
jgi:ornithine carbamoyltransferase